MSGYVISVGVQASVSVCLYLVGPKVAVFMGLYGEEILIL